MAGRLADRRRHGAYGGLRRQRRADPHHGGVRRTGDVGADRVNAKPVPKLGSNAGADAGANTVGRRRRA